MHTNPRTHRAARVAAPCALLFFGALALWCFGALVNPPRSFTDFKPSVNGFHFTNSFSGSPLPAGLSAFAGLGALAGAPQRFGLCGGMSSAAADCFLAGRAMPALDKPPPQGTPLYDYIYQRQVASLGTGLAAATNFADWMQRPDSGLLGTRHLTACNLVPILAALERGQPIILGLVHVAASDQRPIWENHQVLACRAEKRADHSTDLCIYDPNHPGNDGVVVRCEPAIVGAVPIPGAFAVRMPVLGHKCTLKAPATPTRPAREKVVRGFFMLPYEPVAPPDSL